LQPDRIHTLSEIKHSARNGQEISSQGILIEKTSKREFIVTDDHIKIKIDLSAFKKESKILKQNSKIVFSGIYRKRIFTEPVIEVSYLFVVEDFK
jgi:uncharacterized protein YdeI (BOF family)